MKLKKDIIIAVDGHASCGKSTLARKLAHLLKYSYIDTGAMYRAVTLFAIKNNFTDKGKLKKEKLISSLDNIEISFEYNLQTKENTTLLNGKNVEKEIRTMKVSEYASPVAAIPQVRHKLVKMQQKLGNKKRITMDGRDIGTIVFPDADIKIFLTAKAEVRAQRRFNELKNKDENVNFENILKNVKNRDKIDSTRSEGPLKQANDAILLDNSLLNANETFIITASLIAERYGNGVKFKK